MAQKQYAINLLNQGLPATLGGYTPTPYVPTPTPPSPGRTPSTGGSTGIFREGNTGQSGHEYSMEQETPGYGGTGGDSGFLDREMSGFVPEKAPKGQGFFGSVGNLLSGDYSQVAQNAMNAVARASRNATAKKAYGQESRAANARGLADYGNSLLGFEDVDFGPDFVYGGGRESSGGLADRGGERGGAGGWGAGSELSNF